MSSQRVVMISAEPLAHLRSGYHQYTQQWLSTLAQSYEVHSVVLRGTPRPGSVPESDWQVHQLSELGEAGKRLRQMRSIPTSRTMFEASVDFPGCVSQLNKLLDRLRPDVVILNHLRAAWVVKHWRRPDCPVAYIAHDCESAAYLSMSQMGFAGPVRAMLRWDARKLRTLEARVLQAVDICVTLSPDDVERLGEHNRSIHYHVVPPVLRVPAAVTDPASRAADSVVLVGSFIWAPKRRNAIWLAHDVFPQVRARRPNAVLKIVGMAAARLSPQLAGLPGVEIHSDVDSVEPYYNQAQIAVVPEGQASGIKLKTLEAAGRGMAIVTTPCGREGTGLLHGTHCLIAASTDDFAQQILRVMEDDELRAGLGVNARQEVQDRFSRSRVTQEIAAVMAQLTLAPAV